MQKERGQGDACARAGDGGPGLWAGAPCTRAGMKSTAGPGETYTPVILICPSSSRRMLEERGGKHALR